MEYPLLVRGRKFPSVPAGQSRIDTGTFVSGRRRCVKVDLLYPTLASLANVYCGITVGGQNVVQGSPASNYRFLSHPGNYIDLTGNFGENQTYQIITDNGSVTNAVYNFLEFYENPFDTAENRRQLYKMVLATKQVHYAFQTLVSTTNEQTFVIPKNRGRIFAIQPFFELVPGSNPLMLDLAKITVTINGVQIIQNLSAVYCCSESTRNYFFPIDIEPGSTMNVTVENGAGGAVFGGVALFFVPAQNC